MFTIGLLVMIMVSAVVVIYFLTAWAVFITVVAEVFKDVRREMHK